MELTFIHLAVIAVTVSFVIGAGILQSRKVQSAEAYSVGGRSAGVPLVAGSIAGTVVGGGATVGTSQLAYSAGLSAWCFTLGSGLGLILMGVFYAKNMRRTELETIPQFLALHYGKRAEGLSSVITSLGILFSAVASTLSGVEIVAQIFGVSPIAASVILVVLVAGYTFFGGMKSAGIGGILKMIIIWCSIFIGGFFAFETMEETGSFSLLPDQAFSLFGIGVEPALGNLFSVIVGVLCTQSYVQCVFSAATPMTAMVGCITAALIMIPVGLPSVVIGMYMSVFAPGTDPIMVLPNYMVNCMNPIIGGLGMGGILLSLIGSIGGLSLGIGTMISKDMLVPLFRIRDDKKLLWVTKISVLSVMAASCIISILNRGSQVLFWNYLSMSLRGGGILLPFSLAIFCPGRIKKNWAVISMAGSTICSLLTSTVIHVPVDPLFVGLGTSFLLLLPGIRFGKIPEEEKK